MLIFQEVYYYNDHLPIEAVSYWFELCRIASQGECMLLMCNGSKGKSSEMMHAAYLDACERYPVDKTRVYVTGFSHCAAAAGIYAFEYPDEITAIAGACPGMLPHGISGEEAEKAIAYQSGIDMPACWFMGCCEHNSPNAAPTFENMGLSNMIKKNAIAASGCLPKTDDDFRAAFTGNDKAARIVGIPCDRSEILYLEGVEHYICDVKNKEGRWHLRFGAIENCPHNPFPTKQMLEWSFVRRFARDPDTKKIIELY